MSIQKDQFASYKLLAAALKLKGYRIDVDETFPATVTYASPSGNVWQTKAAHIAYPFNTKKVHDISTNKEKAYLLAEENGFSIPYTLHVAEGVSDDILTELLHKFNKLVVKPADLSLAMGLTINIDSLPTLKKAIDYAKSFSSSILVQQQVVGEEIRFTMLNGKVEAALLRSTARVVGDGRTSVAELIFQENEARSRLRFKYLTYPQLTENLVDPSLLESTAIPDKGEIVELNHSTMIRGGCSVYEVLSQVDKSYIELVEQLTAKLGAEFIVVDVFCEDYTKPATPDNHWLIEFNSAPVLKLYYSCRDGKHFNIVSRLAGIIDDWLQRSET